MKEVLLEDNEKLTIKAGNNDVLEVSYVDGQFVVKKTSNAALDLKKQEEKNRMEIYSQCTDWLIHFVDFHKDLCDFIKSDELKENKRYLSFGLETLYNLGSDEKTGKKLYLNLRERDLINPYLNGPVLYINNFNDEIFKYLFAWTLNYFLKAHFANVEIPEDYVNVPISNKTKDDNDDNVEAELYLFRLKSFGEDYLEIYREIANKHNNKESCDFLIETLRAAIPGEKRDYHDNLSSSIYHTIAYEAFVKNECKKGTR